MKQICSLLVVIIMVAACKKSPVLAPAPVESATPAYITDIEAAGTNSSIKIGTQRWMAKNLNASRYRNGDLIPHVTDNASWAALTTGAWCWYKNDSATYAATYGKLYNLLAVNDPRGLAPEGWHIPSYTEWTILSTFLGGDEIAGGKMKETGTSHWRFPNTGATNSSGFTGLAGGNRNGHYGGFVHFGDQQSWWSSTGIEGTFDAWCFYVTFNSGNLQKTGRLRGGFPVRCVKD